MGSAPVVAAATKGSLGLTMTHVAGLGVFAAMLAMMVAMLRAAARAGDARSHGDAGSRLSALADLVAAGLLTPEDYAARRAAILNESGS